MDDAPADYVGKQLRAIVGFEIDIHDIVGKYGVTFDPKEDLVKINVWEKANLDPRTRPTS